MPSNLYNLLLISLLICGPIQAQNEFKGITNAGMIYVGALENRIDLQSEYTYHNNQDTAVKQVVRIIFYKEADEWHSLQNSIGDSTLYPAKVEWTIAFDGKDIGTFHSESQPILFIDATWTYPRDAYHSPVEKNLPIIGSLDSNFPSWQYEKNYRPLVVISQPNCKDPDNWKPFSPSQKMSEDLYPIYKEYILRTLDIDTVKLSHMVFLKSYQSERSDQLIQLGMQSRCNDEYFIAFPIWIYVSNSGRIKNISETIDYKFMQESDDDDFSRCSVIDAGDYDNDGKSEVIFWTDRYDGDGYALFYDDFNKMVDFVWRYH